MIYPTIKRTYNTISIKTAKNFARALRRRKYKVRRHQQWVDIWAESLDTEVSRIAKYYGAIAY